MEPIEGRRPLKSRSAAPVRAIAAWLCRIGATPNAISGASVVFAMAGAACFLLAPMAIFPSSREAATGDPFSTFQGTPMSWALCWIAVAAFVQMRLLCNLFDGMVAIEGGKKTPTGDLWNEIPDRIADLLLLAGAGFAAGAPWAGALAAWGAVLTAYLRAFGASLTGQQDFSGPFAKPQRMAVLTAAAVLTAMERFWTADPWIMKAALWTIAGGTLITAVRRTRRLAACLRAGQ
jgi:phosphatidylglycerophosphate synthase